MRYDFDFEPISVYACAVALIAKHAPTGGVHLDLGCGEGAISEKVAQMGLTYIGLDASAESVANLQARGIEAYPINLDEPERAIAQMMEICGDRHISSISMLDVVEHLPPGNAFLGTLSDWAQSLPGRPPLVVSVPNFAHLDVAAKLLAGRWDYTKSGLLDDTHSTIYTAPLLDSVMRSSGWSEDDRNDYLLELSDQYRLEPMVLLNREAGIGRHLRSIKELVDADVGVHQFVRLYRPAAAEKRAEQAKISRLLTLVLRGASDPKILTEALNRLGLQTDQDFSVYLLDGDIPEALCCANSRWKERLRQAVDPDAVIIEPLASRYWTVLDATDELDATYISRAREAIERHSDQVAIFLDKDLGAETGHFCITPFHFAEVPADPTPHILIPSAYSIEFENLTRGLFEETSSWRSFLLRMSCRAGMWHEPLAGRMVVPGLSVTRFGDVAGYAELLSQAATSIWPRANELAALMSASGTFIPEEMRAQLAAADEARSELLRMQQTLSWKITSPLRLANHLAHGRWSIARSMAYGIARGVFSMIPLRGRMKIRSLRSRMHRFRELAEYSPQNAPALAGIVAYRCSETDRIADRLRSGPSEEPLPAIDISVVTYNSERWVQQFTESLLRLDYPRELLTITFVDNSSTDGTVEMLKQHSEVLRQSGIHSDVLLRPNLGFGAGHNSGLANGTAPFCLVSNLDLEFDPHALLRIAREAQSDDVLIASWEFRQKPYEHPKYYDPVTGLTNWNSHACVLLRRSAFEAVNGYDKNLFMYGEDVELSYRLRQRGFYLKYCPSAVVFHYTYESAGQVKPIQYTGSIYANFYLRLKYGVGYDVMMIPLLVFAVLVSQSPYPGSRLQLVRKLMGLIRIIPRVVKERHKSSAAFPFRGFDYEIVRRGAFVEAHDIDQESTKLISVITRTYRGRETYLKQALLSVFNQSHPKIELVVAEDGGDSMRDLVESFGGVKGREIKFVQLEKVGRSAAGNAGLQAASGDLIVFLDDDDLLFSDHLESLAKTLRSHPEAVAAYSPAMELVTDAELIGAGKYYERIITTPAALVGDFCYDSLRVRNCMAIQSVLFYRKLFEERGGFEEDMDALEDWNLWCRYAAGNKFIYVDKVTSLYRVPSDTSKLASRQKALDDSYTLALQRLQRIEADYLS